jgi:ceramide glucosyltransferase
VLAFWILTALALAMALASLRGDRRRAEYVRRELVREAPPESLRPATVIVPVKGRDEGLRENLASLAALDYPDYELIVVARSAGDLPEGVAPARARIVLAGDPPAGAAEKIGNLLAAVAAARPESEIFAFADSDGRVAPRWLRALAAPLAGERAGASTGYRWYLPQPPDFASLLRSVWNSVIGGSFGPGGNRFAWGGAMAVRRDVFERARVADYWSGAISDDYRLSQAVRAAGLEIVYAPGALVVSNDHVRPGGLLRWIARQMIITRVYEPRLWWVGFAAHAVYCAAMAAAVAVAWRGSLWGEYSLVAQWGLGMLKAANRAALAKSALPEWKTWFDRHGWVLTWWSPLGTWVWLYGFLASAGRRTIEWRGVKYRLRPPGRLPKGCVGESDSEPRP